MVQNFLKIFILSASVAFMPCALYAQYSGSAARFWEVQNQEKKFGSAREELEYITGERVSDYDLSIDLENKIRKQEQAKARARQQTGTTIEEVNASRNRRTPNNNSKLGLRISSDNSAWRERQRMIREERERRRREIERRQTQEALQHAAKLNAMEAEMTARLQNQIASNTNWQNVKNVEEYAAVSKDFMKTGNVINGKPAENKDDINQDIQTSDREIDVLLKILEKTDSMADFSDTEIVKINAFFDSIDFLPA